MFIISTLTIAIYLSSSALMAFHLAQGVQRLPYQKYTSVTLSLCGLLLHLMILYHTIILANGINLSVFNALSLVAWMILLLWHLLLALRQPIEFLTIVILPIAAVSIALAAAYPALHLLNHLPMGLQVHIVLALLAYSLLSLAAVQAILLAIHDHSLHHHRPAGFIRALPPLQTMEKILFDIIGLGFIVLSLALALGLGFIQDIMAQHLAHKTILSFFSWLIFAILLSGHWQLGWRSKMAIYWTLGGVFTLILAYFGSKLVLELILHRV